MSEDLVQADSEPADSLVRSPDRLDVFVMPNDWQFYQADLSFDVGHVCIAAEPHGSVAMPVITFDVTDKVSNATLFLYADEALEIWTALGYAIRNSSGKEPIPVELIPSSGDREVEPERDAGRLNQPSLPEVQP